MRGVSVLSVPLSNGIFFIAFYTIILFEDSNKSLISEKPKEVLNMFSEALRILDRNTAELIVDYDVLRQCNKDTKRRGCRTKNEFSIIKATAPLKSVQKMGLEPTRGNPHKNLNLARLPFRHFCIYNI